MCNSRDMKGVTEQDQYNSGCLAQCHVIHHLIETALLFLLSFLCTIVVLSTMRSRSWLLRPLQFIEVCERKIKTVYKNSKFSRLIGFIMLVHGYIFALKQRGRAVVHWRFHIIIAYMISSYIKKCTLQFIFFFYFHVVGQFFLMVI